ncbi:MAG TPA: DUF2141 domain-containing protein [Brevundimonas sp.]|jgi:uncharacterized protein (DUF2141 family)|uniref:DUF2141 domain-containing protein n=1 Tax=Brevundimonas sp. TaxID=1871086 RepID=UPI002DF72BB3|nr:DUF2141 domain-containing protein [Brevundimonas sp.]
MKTLIAAALLLAAPAAAYAQDSGRITFEFATARAEGAVMLALFDSADAYAGRGAPVANRMVPVGADGASVTFEDLPAGDYAMRAFHDVNGDGQMNTNPFGMPTEPYAFSNNAVGNMGPASWDRASFRVDGAVTQVIELK